MLINLRNALMAGRRLPYDAEVEYLESTGTQWVDTGVKGNASASLIIECTFLQKQPRGTVGFVFGSRSATDERFGFAVVPGGVGGNYTFGYRDDHAYNVALSSNFETVRFVATPTVAECTFRGTTLTASNAPLDTNLNIYIFTRNFSGRTGQNFEGCLASLKIYSNNVLVRDYIPVRVGAVGYLYDRVSGKLFGNAGTGDFVLGPDVVPVEYIESHGTEYIDVGPIVGADEVIVKLSASSIPSSGCYKAFGVGYTSNFGDDFGINSSGWCGQSYAPVSLDTQSTAKMNQSGRFIDSKNLGGSSSPFFTKVAAGNRLFLFCGTNGSSAYIKGSGNYMAWRGRFYSCVVSSSGNKMFNHLPIRVGTEGAMMDVLTRRIYRNVGTGAFAYGNDLKYPIPAE